MAQRTDGELCKEHSGLLERIAATEEVMLAKMQGVMDKLGSHSKWMGSGIVVFVAIFAYSSFIQVPGLRESINREMARLELQQKDIQNRQNLTEKDIKAIQCRIDGIEKKKR